MNLECLKIGWERNISSSRFSTLDSNLNSILRGEKLGVIGKDNLENILRNYKGTTIFDSHDRYFTNKIADKLLVFDKDGIEYVQSNYNEYERKRRNSEKLFNKVEQKAAKKWTQKKLIVIFQII